MSDPSGFCSWLSHFFVLWNQNLNADTKIDPSWAKLTLNWLPVSAQLRPFFFRLSVQDTAPCMLVLLPFKPSIHRYVIFRNTCPNEDQTLEINKQTLIFTRNRFHITQGWFFAFAPIVIAGVLSIYGIIVAVIIAGKMEGMESTLAYKCFSAGFSVGLSCLASGLAMGKFLDKYLAGPSTSSARPSSEIERPLVGSSRSLRSAPCSGWGLLIVMVFLEAIGLYGLIVALILSAWEDIMSLRQVWTSLCMLQYCFFSDMDGFTKFISSSIVATTLYFCLVASQRVQRAEACGLIHYRSRNSSTAVK